MGVTRNALIDDVTGQVRSADLGGVINSNGVIASSLTINGLVAAETALIVGTSGKVIAVTGMIVRILSQTGLSGVARAGGGITAGAANDIFANTQMTAFNTTTELYIFATQGNINLVTATDTFYFKVNTAFSGTAVNLGVYLLGAIINL